MAKHGTVTRYTQGCSCSRCRRTWRDYHKKYRAGKAAGSTPKHVHGTVNGYRNFGCRCKRCRAAHAESMREYRKVRS